MSGLKKFRRVRAKKEPKTLEEIVRHLAPADQNEVREFAERLLAKGKSEAHPQPRFAWAGALRICATAIHRLNYNIKLRAGESRASEAVG